MRMPPHPTVLPLPALAPLPGWIVETPADTLEVAAFRSGAALAHLCSLITEPRVPQALWRDRLALMAAGACVAMSGRREDIAALRDAVHLTRPGDDPGPAGAIVMRWSRATTRPVSFPGLGRELVGVSAELALRCLRSSRGDPVARAARAAEAVLSENLQAESAALILADAVLARSLGHDRMLPLLALGLKPRDMAARGEALRLACHRAVAIGASQAAPMATDLARQALRLREIAPSLRARGAARAVELFLSRDSVAPAALARFMSDRAARRLCDRLVELGAVRELTGRASFRFYGI